MSHVDLGKTKCCSSPQEHQQENHRCLKPNAYHVPLLLVIDQTALHLYARAAPLINCAGSAGHVLTVLWIRVWFVIFTMRGNFWGSLQRNWVITAEKTAVHCLILFSVLFKGRYWTFPAETHTQKEYEYVWQEHTQGCINFKNRHSHLFTQWDIQKKSYDVMNGPCRKNMKNILNEKL